MCLEEPYKFWRGREKADGLLGGKWYEKTLEMGRSQVTWEQVPGIEGIGLGQGGEKTDRLLEARYGNLEH